MTHLNVVLNSPSYQEKVLALIIFVFPPQTGCSCAVRPAEDRVRLTVGLALQLRRAQPGPSPGAAHHPAGGRDSLVVSCQREDSGLPSPSHTQWWCCSQWRPSGVSWRPPDWSGCLEAGPGLPRGLHPPASTNLPLSSLHGHTGTGRTDWRWWGDCSPARYFLAPQKRNKRLACVVLLLISYRENHLANCPELTGKSQVSIHWGKQELPLSQSSVQTLKSEISEIFLYFSDYQRHVTVLIRVHCKIV